MNQGITMKILALLTILFMAASLGPGPIVQAQFFDETLEQDEFFVEDEDQFFEPRGDDFGTSFPEQDFTEGNRFIDESLTPADGRGLTRGDRQFQLTLESDRDDLPLNIAWGAGTGLLIGGWFALINEGSNRETQRSIGIGIVVGIILGTLVGTRSVFDPEAPRPIGQSAPPAEGPAQFTPLVSLQPEKPSIGFQMTF